MLNNSGRGIANTRITITDMQGNQRITQGSSFGYFRFTDVAVGMTYIVTVRAKRAAFSQPTQVIYVNDAIDNIIFIADD